MQKKIRPDPLIPDHEVLRKIGGGAYGEVWLARGVTGALRAVKIVYREDFSDERTFEREFEGILRFEPISRDHRGFVNILHVGRSDEGSAFYYYVMELGDDAYSAGEVNAVEYEPRTLRTDMKRADGAPLDTKFCVETGRRLAEALASLHERGLTHRDVKPSNVIFVEGKAKLADIGLVAAKDQRTFVGTEGFVPPEGPGSEQADIYGLGKVLYEMASGMDRLQFPELPEDGPGDDSRKQWIRLNRVICDICEPRISKRKIQTGEELAIALARLEEGKAVAKKIPASAKVALGVLALFLLFLTQIWVENSWGTYVIEGKREPLPPSFVTVRILSDAEGARVLNMDRVLLDYIPATLPNQEVGTQLEVILRADGYRELFISEEVRDDGDGTQVMLISREMELFSPPVEDEPWTDALGNTYFPEGPRHKGVNHVTLENWKEFQEDTGQKDLKPISYEYSEQTIVSVSEDWANQYAEWLMEKCINEGYFEEDIGEEGEADEESREIVADYDRTFPLNRLPKKARANGKVLYPFTCLVRPIPFGIITVESYPEGAVLYLKDIPVGETPWSGRYRPGSIDYTLELAGYRPVKSSISLTAGGHASVSKQLEPNKSVVPGKLWSNSLGMNMVPIGADEDLMVASWETRSVDYRRYLKNAKLEVGEVILSDDPNVPVTGVTREDCEKFCEWLTLYERGDRITKEYRYRLPTDEEWSQFVNLVELGATPESRERETDNADKFPWGKEWPPPSGAGNYADASRAEDASSEVTIGDYEDGFAALAPVGQFTPIRAGGEDQDWNIYDLGGNVWEWVADNYKELGTLRGGAWNTHNQSNLESRHRRPQAATSRQDFIGFRVVLVKEPELAVEEDQEESEKEDNGGDPN